MKVVVDLVMCEGNAKCVEAAPSVFALGDDDKSRVLLKQPPESLRERVKLAARICPRQAITITEE